MKWLRWTFLLLAASRFALATEVKGRFVLGGYLATEHFSSDVWGSSNNDSEVVSARMFLQVTDIDHKPWEVISDLRDKNDFFGKADTERLEMTPLNTPQVVQLFTRYNDPKSMFAATLGRFAVPEAGTNGVDGAQVEFKHGKDWNGGVFGGLNPRLDDQTYYQWNPNDQIYGVSTTYQDRSLGWERNLFLTHALVTERESGQVTRTYFFHNSIYQWAPQDRLIALLYLDFVPRTYVQNGNVIWQQTYRNKFSSQLNVFGVDVITYTHQQSVLERLAPSPYKEGDGKVDYALSDKIKWEVGFSDGVRDADGLTRQEYYVGADQNRYWHPNWDVFLKVGERNNFTSFDQFANLLLGYYRGDWEADFSAEYAAQIYTDGSPNKHPFTAEIDVSRYFSRALYGTLSLQRAADETVEIWSGFFTLGYRFGSGPSVVQREMTRPRSNL